MRFAPALWYFLAGVAASAATNLVTAIPQVAHGRESYMLAALPWFALAALSAMSGAETEDIRRQTDLMSAPTLSPIERNEIEHLELKRRHGKLVTLQVLALVSLLLAVVLMSNLFLNTQELPGDKTMPTPKSKDTTTITPSSNSVHEGRPSSSSTPRTSTTHVATG
jgi:hypothetical protein